MNDFFSICIRFSDEKEKTNYFGLPGLNVDLKIKSQMISSESNLKYIIGYTLICLVTSIILEQDN